MPFDPANVAPPGAKIKVIGVGGGGGNAINTMIRSELDGVDFIAANTDVQALRFSLAPHKIQIGKELTRGLGAGADPDIGRDAALEDRHEIQELLTGADMVFITAGMGGGTGTGGASVVAQIARELGALTVAVVTKPFGFEGKRRRKHADVGIGRLRECVDTLITIPNQRLLHVADPSVSMIGAFKMADDVLVNAVRGISDIINIPGTVNVDFADVKTVMSCMGQALMGIGAATGEKRAVEAARMAIKSPLLEDIDIEGATGILINITAGSDVTLMEVNEACSIIQEAAHEDANIIFGAVIDEELGGQMRVTVIATGFPVDKDDEVADTPQVIKPAASTLVSPYGARLTTQSPLVTKPQARPELRREHYAPLTSRKAPEAPRPRAPEARPKSQETGPVVGPMGTVMGAQLAPEPTIFEPQMAARAGAVPEAARPVMDRSALGRSPFDRTGEPELRPSPALGTHGAEAMSAMPADTLGREEAQELARWTLDAADAGGFLGGDDIPSLAAEPPPAAAEPLQPPPAAPLPPPASEPRFEGARAFQGYESEETTVAEALFSADADLDGDDPRLLAEPPPAGVDSAVRQAGAIDPRAGASREQAPLETFFDAGQGQIIGDDIERKINEALDLAERMRHPRRASEGDDLDVPAFLRNGMKDLPLD